MTKAYYIKGMTCDHCVATVRKAVEAIPGVQNAIVRLEAPQLVVREEGPVDRELVQQAVSAAGNFTLDQ